MATPSSHKVRVEPGNGSCIEKTLKTSGNKGGQEGDVEWTRHGGLASEVASRASSPAAVFP